MFKTYKNFESMEEHECKNSDQRYIQHLIEGYIPIALPNKLKLTPLETRVFITDRSEISVTIYREKERTTDK